MLPGQNQNNATPNGINENDKKTEPEGLPIIPKI